jgi:hypothetical protein
MLKQPKDLKKNIDLKIIENRKGLITPGALRGVLKEIIDYAADAQQYFIVADTEEFRQLLDDLQDQIQIELNKELDFNEAINFRQFAVYIQNSLGLASVVESIEGRPVEIDLGTYTDSESKVLIVNERSREKWKIIFHNQTAVDYTNSEEMPVDIGGLEAGTTFSGDSIASILDRLLYPYQVPQLSISSNVSEQTLEVGQALLTSPNTWRFSYISDFPQNIDEVFLKKNGVIVSTGIFPNEMYTYTFDYDEEPNILRSAGVVEWKIGGLDIQGNSIESPTLRYQWKYRTFWGTSALDDIGDYNLLNGLNSSLSRVGSVTKVVTVQEEYLYMFVPVEYSLYSTFKVDGIGVVMDEIENVTLSRLNVDVEYRKYRVFNKSFGGYTLVLT